jgi:ABC-2 type transport system permease protein
MKRFAVIRLVMGREIHQRLRSRGFAITTVLICVGVLGAGVLNRALRRDDGPSRVGVGVIGVIPAGFESALQATADALGIEVRVTAVPGVVDADVRLRDRSLDAVVDTTTGELLADREPGAELSAAVNAAWQASASRAAAAAAGLDEGQIDAVLSPGRLRLSLLHAAGRSDDSVGRLVGSAAAILLFVSINAFGGMVLTGVVEEKSTGVVEVLLAHVRAHQLLAGKVFGIGAVALMQFGAAVLTGVVALRISGVTVPGSVWIGLPSAILWFLVGFILYSTLFALAGSFVSRQEDAQSAAAPISMVFTAAYLTVFVLGSSPSSTATRVLSVLPPFAPLLMPLRIAVGSASVVEIVSAVVLLLAATFAMLRLAGAVYGRTLLHRGARLHWREALRMRSG